MGNIQLTVGLVCGVVLAVLLVLPVAAGDRDEFPGQRRGGGTHWAGARDEFPGRRQGGGGQS
jgi:hypothetical protein